MCFYGGGDKEWDEVGLKYVRAGEVGWTQGVRRKRKKSEGSDEDEDLNAGQGEVKHESRKTW